jgi:hypothetical protein
MAYWITVLINALMVGGMALMVFVRSGKKQAALEQKQDSDQERITKVEIALLNHAGDSVPHKLCLEHAAVIKSIDNTLKRFESSLSTLDVRVYDMVKNGGKRPHIGYGS